ncbi:MAG TPA: class I SAM-dependent methyltransferase [Caulobacteraceae bacterium]|nr:class I SAM-dependent methyltransferase [Caulobacteraceae bacterium]
MAQNIYDTPDFFAGYSRMNRSVNGLDGAVEWPAVRALLPDLTGRRVVDLGCGFGWFSRWARANGAASVLALDISARMIERARAETDDAAITYRIEDLERLTLPAGGFDLAFSSLAFHYLPDFAGLARTVRAALTPGAAFVFTIEHPIYMAPSRPDWAADADGRRSWPLNGYADEGQRTTDWLAKGVVKFHRTLATTLNTLIGAGFQIVRLDEWAPSEAEAAADPTLASGRDRPMFLLVSARV